MMFLSEYGMFLLKSITVVISIAIVTLLFFAIRARAKKSKAEGVLVIKDLSQHFQNIKLQMTKAVASKTEAKSLLKETKKLIKNKKKQKDKARSKIFIVKFKGDIKATAVESLKEEITAILSIASINDEVALILESPGGTVSGYGLAASELDRVSQKGLKLTVLVDQVAASGGYMMACIANKIIAAPFSIIGSIGVITQMPNFNRLLEDKGVKFEQIKSGKYKRTVTMFGKNTDEDRQKLRAELEEMHYLFKSLIKTKRPEIDIDKVATGEYWLGTKAKQLGLVDELMTSDDYLMSLYEKEMNMYMVEYKREVTLMSRMLGAYGKIKEALMQGYIT